MSMKRSLTVIVKPTLACNLSCRYCCVGHYAKHKRMSFETLEMCIKQVQSIPGKDNINWIWHGGEPTLMGIDFFDQVIALQEKFRGSRYIRNNIQTNATLLYGAFLNFLIDNNFKITSSIDGPPPIHNLTRVYSDGRGTFDDTWKVIKSAQKRIDSIIASGGSHPGLSLICVLNKSNINEIDKIYEFFSSKNINLKLNPLINIGCALDDLEGLGLKEHEYGTALIKFFERWFYEKELGISVSPLSEMLISLLKNKSSGCQAGGTCRGNFISIDPEGNVYPCGRFDGVPEYWLGNIHQQRLQNIINSERHIEIDNVRHQAVADSCKACSCRIICSNGCLFNSYLNKKNGGKKDPYCESYKMLFQHLRNAINKELKKE